MDEYDLLAKALGLQPPWLVKEVKFSKEEGRLDLWIYFQKGTRFACPSCGRQECQVHDTQDKSWRHLNFFQYQSFFHVKVPRTSCP